MRILIVADETRIAAFVGRAFEAEGWGVDVATDGDQGLELALAGTYSLVILDLLLPGRGGLAALAELHERRPDLPVLILSARADLSTKLRGFDLGAVDYVAKPFSLDASDSSPRCGAMTSTRVPTSSMSVSGDSVAGSDRRRQLRRFAMWGIARPREWRRLVRRYNVELWWLGFAAANYAAMIAWPNWETIPFHFVWISLTLLYGFRVWRLRPTLVVLAGVMTMTGVSIGLDASDGEQLWGELFEVPPHGGDVPRHGVCGTPAGG